ncbi:hypothetical protein [Noviherbaspirillum pedocola]|uniref:Uncharacterized protein n=1 Tax=Noviherbaspirillum pedocola TaxID=2801341 RepID=A0A934T2P5_9BURK|nr:hypothetical protein [Noviherbaspirillum pedocola]MBK4737033.1 hypothetical protein [Noviherbaspirillum pedocola]
MDFDAVHSDWNASPHPSTKSRSFPLRLLSEGFHVQSHPPIANRRQQPTSITASDSQDVERDYSFDKLCAMPIPPCTASEYAALKDNLFVNGPIVCLSDQVKAGALAMEFLRNGKTTVMNGPCKRSRRHQSWNPWYKPTPCRHRLTGN